MLLPELGEARASADRATLVEAIRCGLATLVAERPAALLLDDLQWSDEATIELLAALALTAARAAAAGRRRLPLRRAPAHAPAAPAAARPAARPRAGRDRAGAASTRRRPASCIAQLAGGDAEPAADAAAARPHGRHPVLRRGAHGRAAAGRPAGATAPTGSSSTLDERRAAAARRCATPCWSGSPPLDDAARAAAETAAVAGARFDLDARRRGSRARTGSASCSPAGCWSRRRTAAPRSATRWCATRVYDDVPWLRRRALHRATRRRAARRAAATPPRSPAHWLAARDPPRALEALLRRRSPTAPPSTPTATPRGSAARRSTSGPRASREPSASPRSSARPLRRAGRRARRGRPRPARGRRRAPRLRRRPRAGRRRAPDGVDLRRCRATVPRARRAPRRRRGLRGQRAAGRGRGRAARHRGLPAVRRRCTPRRRGRRGRPREEAVRAERADLQARAMGLEGVARVEGRRLRRGHRDDPGGPLAGARARAHRRGAPRSTSASAPRARSPATTPARATRSARRSASATPPGEGAAAHLPELHGLRPARARRLGRGRASSARDLIAPGAAPDDTLVADGVLGAIEAWRGRGRRGLPLLTRCLETSRAAERRLDAVRQRRGARLAGRARRATRGARGALPRRCSPAGSAARTTTTPSGACAGRRAGSRATGDLRHGAGLHGGAVGDRRLGRASRRARGAGAARSPRRALAEGDSDAAGEQFAPRRRAPRRAPHPVRAGPDPAARAASRSPPPESATPRWTSCPRPTGSRRRWAHAPLAAEAAAAVAALGASLGRPPRPPRRRRARDGGTLAAGGRGRAARRAAA